MRTPPVAVLGVDLSLRGAAACALGARWEPGDWAERVQVCALAPASLPNDAPQLARHARVVSIVRELHLFARRWGSEAGFIEQHAFAQGALAGHSAVMELTGALKFFLAEHCSLPLEPVVASAARKYLLGKLPPRDVKVRVHQALYDAGAPKSWSGDVLDAFCVANYGRTELGLPGLTLRSA